jgi:hypothetical protein
MPYPDFYQRRLRAARPPGGDGDSRPAALPAPEALRALDGVDEVVAARGKASSARLHPAPAMMLVAEPGAWLPTVVDDRGGADYACTSTPQHRV